MGGMGKRVSIIYRPPTKKMFHSSQFQPTTFKEQSATTTSTTAASEIKPNKKATPLEPAKNVAPGKTRLGRDGVTWYVCKQDKNGKCSWAKVKPSASSQKKISSPTTQMQKHPPPIDFFASSHPTLTSSFLPPPPQQKEENPHTITTTTTNMDLSIDSSLSHSTSSASASALSFAVSPPSVHPQIVYVPVPLNLKNQKFGF